MNKEKINKILEDIYLIDPSLRSQEKKIITIIEETVAAAPEVKLDSKFIDNLREKILSEIKSTEERKSLFPGFTFDFKKTAYIVAGASIVVLLAIFSWSQHFEKDPFLSDSERMIALGDKAFGELQLDFFAAPSGLGAESDRTASFIQDSQERALSAEASEIDMDSQVSSRDIAIMPYPIDRVQYEYVYHGSFLDELDLSEISNFVYRRKKDESVSRQAARNLPSIPGLPVDVNKFSQRELVNFYFNENKDFGYSVSVNLVDNLITINNNWATWPNPYDHCFDEKCFNELRITINDIPSEEKIISLANDFIKRFGVDLKDYGSAEVDNVWRESYERSKSPADYYLPDQISVIYPLLIEGQEVFDQSGNKDGVRVNINLHQQQAIGLNNLYFSSYEKAAYDLVDDKDKIRQALSKGGLQTFFYYGDQEEKQIFEVTDPQIALVKTWLRAPQPEFRLDEIFVPCLIFTVSESPEGHFYPRKIIVPLIDEVLENVLRDYDNQGQGIGSSPRILPMPIIEPGVENIMDLPLTEPIKPEDIEGYDIMPID